MATRYTDEFRRDAVRIATTSGLTRPQVSSDLGVGLSTLNKWVQKHQHDDLKHPAGGINVIQHHIGELHNEPANHDVSDTNADYVAAFEFIEKRHGQVSFCPLLLLSIVCLTHNSQNNQ